LKNGGRARRDEVEANIEPRLTTRNYDDATKTKKEKVRQDEKEVRQTNTADLTETLGV